MQPVNLRKQLGDRYKVTKDREAMETPRDRSPWLHQVRTRVGWVYPHSDTLLAVTCDGHPQVAAALRKAGLRLWQDGDREKTFLCDVPTFLELVAPVVRPRRRRRYKDAATRAVKAAQLAEVRSRRASLAGA